MDGPFDSLADLCDRIPPSILNRRTLESLIHCGALDNFHPESNRCQLIADLDLIIDWAASRARDRASGQGNLFDFSVASTDNNVERDISSAPKASNVKDYPPTEKLRLEKELLGFYLSDHPLKQLSEPAKLIAPISLIKLDDQKDKAKVSVIAMIKEMRVVTTRKGDKMAILQVEDLAGSCEAVVFPKSFYRLSDHLLTEARLLIWASVDRRDENVQLIVDDCRSIDQMRFVLVNLLPEQINNIEYQHRLRECIYKYRPGKDELGVKVPVVAAINDVRGIKYVRLGHQFCVKDPKALIDALRKSSFQASCSESLVK